MISETLSKQRDRHIWEKYRPSIDEDRCIGCGKCVNECSFGALELKDKMVRYLGGCVACGRCMSFCPSNAITVTGIPSIFPYHPWFTERDRRAIAAQARSGGVLLSSCGTDLPYRSIFDDLLLDAAQVTNPSIDPLREPIETKTYLGRRSGKLCIEKRAGKYELVSGDGAIVALDMPLMIGHISLGSVSYNAQKALFTAAENLNLIAGSGEGGLHPDFFQFSHRINSEVASGRFGVTPEYLKRVAAVEIKIGQGAKPGHGGHLPGEKVTEMISQTRMIPEGTDALSPYPHHDIYSIEDLQQLISVLKEATDYLVPVGVKVAAVHNIGAISSGIVRAGADFITIDGFRGGTGSAPRVIRDHAGIPIEVAIATVDQKLTEEGLRNKITLCASGSIRSSADMIKIIALGADVASVCTAPMVAMGCKVCQHCHLGICAWGIATQKVELASRLDPRVAANGIMNLFRAWNEELREVMGAMGIDSVESLVGNRDRLRYIGPNPRIADVMAIKHVGQGWG